MTLVYLDSSDYSVMSDDQNPEAQELRSFLKSQVDLGIIDVRFSQLHVLEGAHVDARAKPMAVRRAELMNEMSGKNCLLWWRGLLEEETTRLAQDRTLQWDEYALREDGHWFPPLTGIADQLSDVFRNSLKEVIDESGLPRAQRRGTMRTLWRKGRLTKRALDMMRPHRQQMNDELRDKYPFPENFYENDLLFRHAAGEIPAQDIIDALEDAFGDLPFFVGWVYDRHDPKKTMTEWLRAGKLGDAITELRTKVSKAVELSERVGRNEKDVNAALRNARSKLNEYRARFLRIIFEDIGAQLNEQGIDRNIWDARVIGSEIRSIPSLDAVLEVLIEYFVRNAMSGNQQRKLRISDYGDVLHMGFMPYVDIFRCDSYFADLARQIAARYDTVLVGSLTDLPEAISAK